MLIPFYIMEKNVKSFVVLSAYIYQKRYNMTASQLLEVLEEDDPRVDEVRRIIIDIKSIEELGTEYQLKEITLLEYEEALKDCRINNNN